MQKLILRCPYALGDTVLLTAALRDLHLCCPRAFQTDVRTGFVDVWANNPHLTALEEYDKDVRIIDCDMPLIERSDQAGVHALNGFLQFLGQQLNVGLRLTDFRGDIHLSSEERNTSPAVWGTGGDFPFWLIGAGGKYDCTVKWWEPARYQAVVDHFRDRIQFVQVGRLEHFHPRLRGVIDLRGRTTVRELINLMHHADGVLCGVTSLMHLAAAVPMKPPRRFEARACVVVAGGREPPHWEAYPGHQFIHTVGTLACCARGGCWKSRTKPLGDDPPRRPGAPPDKSQAFPMARGSTDRADAAEKLCVDVRGEWPRCMDMISAGEVIGRIELYLKGRSAVLSGGQVEHAAQAVQVSEKQPVPDAPLNFYNAPRAAREFIEKIPAYPPGRFAGRGIVICAGGARMFTNAWVCLQRLRRAGCKLPVQLWYFGKQEMDATMKELVRPLGATCVDATAPDVLWSAKVGGGWSLKPFAILNCPFEEVLLLDADNVPVQNPEFLFDSEPFKEYGAVLWPDIGRLAPEANAWKLFDTPYRDEPEVESGQVLVNKRKCWRPLVLTMWYNENASLFYKHVHGDKETFHLAFRRLGMTYAMPEHPCVLTQGAMYQHDFDGQRLFQHRNQDKWDLLGRNRPVTDFWHEQECLAHVRELAQRWDGQMGWLKEAQAAATAAVAGNNGTLKFAIIMPTCAERDTVRAGTLERLEAAGWRQRDVFVAVDERRFAYRVDSLTHTAWRALQKALTTDADYVLYLEDDVAFNRYLRQNLNRWGPLARRELQIGSLCNYAYRELAWDVAGDAYLVHPLKFKGSQAVLLSRQMVQYCLEHWTDGRREVDIKFGQLAAKAKQPMFVHCPSLVDHIGRSSTLGNEFMEVVDFDPAWKSNAKPLFELVDASWGQ